MQSPAQIADADAEERARMVRPLLADESAPVFALLSNTEIAQTLCLLSPCQSQGVLAMLLESDRLETMALLHCMSPYQKLAMVAPHGRQITTGTDESEDNEIKSEKVRSTASRIQQIEVQRGEEVPGTVSDFHLNRSWRDPSPNSASFSGPSLLHDPQTTLRAMEDYEYSVIDAYVRRFGLDERVAEFLPPLDDDNSTLSGRLEKPCEKKPDQVSLDSHLKACVAKVAQFSVVNAWRESGGKLTGRTTPMYTNEKGNHEGTREENAKNKEATQMVVASRPRPDQAWQVAARSSVNNDIARSAHPVSPFRRGSYYTLRAAIGEMEGAVRALHVAGSRPGAGSSDMVHSGSREKEVGHTPHSY